VFYLRVAALRTRAILNNYTAGAAGRRCIEIYSAASVEGKEELLSARERTCVYAHACTHTHALLRAQLVGYAETHVQGYPPRSRSRRPVSDNRHQSSNDPPYAYARMCLHAEGGGIGEGEE